MYSEYHSSLPMSEVFLFCGGGSNKLKMELLMLERMRHPNIVQFLGAVTKSLPPVIVTEYLPRVCILNHKLLAFFLGLEITQQSYSFNSMRFWAGVGSLSFRMGCFANKINNFLPLEVHAQRWFLNMKEEQPTSVH